MTRPEKEIRTRIAPSPTGDPHIGTAYQLLFDYAFARSQGGKCVLRIEDTDQARSTAESEQAILDSLRWLGIPWDEGPDVGGPHGPYRQSERTAIYREHCDLLLEKGHAYRCFCTADRLAELRKQQEAEKANLGYDGHCAALAPEEVREKMEAGVPFVVRMKVPEKGECVIEDMLRGDIKVPWEKVDHQVLMKSDGFPTYHLANVVDDHLMGITHVLRGEEWISSAPKHQLLYEYFGWEMPALCHLPLLRNPDKSKLSKRKNPTSIFYYRDAGFLPEAVVNYLGLMGYTLPSGEELFSLEEMVASFDIHRVSLGGPIFDLEKLSWLNGRYLREKLDRDTLFDRLQGWKMNAETWKRILPLIQPRVEKLSEIIPATAFFFADSVAVTEADLVPKKLQWRAEVLPADLKAPPEPPFLVARLLQILLWELEKARPWTKQALEDCVRGVAEQEQVKIRDCVVPLFVALTGSPSATPLFDSMEILGSDVCRRRILAALDVLAAGAGALSKKKLKALEKYYRSAYPSEGFAKQGSEAQEA